MFCTHKIAWLCFALDVSGGLKCNLQSKTENAGRNHERLSIGITNQACWFRIRFIIQKTKNLNYFHIYLNAGLGSAPVRPENGREFFLRRGSSKYKAGSTLYKRTSVRHTMKYRCLSSIFFWGMQLYFICSMIIYNKKKTSIIERIEKRQGPGGRDCQLDLI